MSLVALRPSLAAALLCLVPQEETPAIDFVNLGANTLVAMGFRGESVWFELRDHRGYLRGAGFPRFRSGDERYRVTILDREPEMLLHVVDVWVGDEWSRVNPLRGRS